jgi:hypothetical protein
MYSNIGDPGWFIAEFVTVSREYIYICVYDIHTLYTYTYIYMQNSSLSLYVLNKPACMGLTARRVMELH